MESNVYSIEEPPPAAVEPVGLERLEAAVDGRGAAGAEDDTQALSTTSWLRGRLRLGAGAARQMGRRPGGWPVTPP